MYSYMSPSVHTSTTPPGQEQRDIRVCKSGEHVYDYDRRVYVVRTHAREVNFRMALLCVLVPLAAAPHVPGRGFVRRSRRVFAMLHVLAQIIKPRTKRDPERLPLQRSGPAASERMVGRT
jgi:hypothetical protein